MLWFFFCVAILILAYFIYGRVVEKIFVINPKRATPAISLQDGVDYVPMSKGRIWLIQLLNIAGTGPIFGPIMGALYGPVAMLWIVFGCVFAGAVHDYFSGMLSIRNNGESVPFLAGKYLGKPAKHLTNIIAFLLLLLVGVVFVASPASLLTNITSSLIDGNAVGAATISDESTSNTGTILTIWTAIIFIYYIIATLVPIDKIIGKVYPIFGGLLMFMTFGMLLGLLFNGIPFFGTVGTDIGLADFFTNMHPKGAPIWPILFITIACGAVSGFHATQSPLMARCTENEKEGRFIFYGAMIGEGIIALIWCMVGLSFYPDQATLANAIATGTASQVVFDSAMGMLGVVGGVLAVLGVVVLPITSGDTAFRAARLLIADFFKFDQHNLVKRLVIALPLFAVGFWVSTVDFSILWRYFGWANQTTAMIMLWTASAYLFRHQKFHWITTIPAIFMTLVCSTFLANAPIGFGLDYQVSVWVGIGITALATICFFTMLKPMNDEE